MQCTPKPVKEAYRSHFGGANTVQAVLVEAFARVQLGDLCVLKKRNSRFESKLKQKSRRACERIGCTLNLQSKATSLQVTGLTYRQIELSARQANNGRLNLSLPRDADQLIIELLQ